MEAALLDAIASEQHGDTRASLATSLGFRYGGEPEVLAVLRTVAVDGRDGAPQALRAVAERLTDADERMRFLQEVAAGDAKEAVTIARRMIGAQGKGISDDDESDE